MILGQEPRRHTKRRMYESGVVQFKRVAVMTAMKGNAGTRVQARRITKVRWRGINSRAVRDDSGQKDHKERLYEDGVEAGRGMPTAERGTQPANIRAAETKRKWAPSHSGTPRPARPAAHRSMETWSRWDRRRITGPRSSSVQTHTIIS